MEGTYCVYIHTCPDGQMYVGITKQAPIRRWNHGRNYEGQWFYDAIEKWGWENIKHEIVLEGLDEQTAKTKEVELIDSLHTWRPGIGYNNTLKGAGKLIPVRDPVTHKVYSSVSQACKYIGTYPEKIRKQFEFCTPNNKLPDEVYMPYKG